MIEDNCIAQMFLDQDITGGSREDCVHLHLSAVSYCQGSYFAETPGTHGLACSPARLPWLDSPARHDVADVTGGDGGGRSAQPLEFTKTASET